MFNTDQSIQYMSIEFTKILLNAGIKISMDGRDRALDNVWVEHLWLTVEQEEVYIRDYVDGLDAQRSLERYFSFYNEERAWLYCTGSEFPENKNRGKKSGIILKKLVGGAAPQPIDMSKSKRKKQILDLSSL